MPTEYSSGVHLPIARPRASWIGRLFIALFLPVVGGFYAIYKYPLWFSADPGAFYLLGKAPAFWYSLVYTSVVCTIAGWVLWTDRNLYETRRAKGRLSVYQRRKFQSIYVAQSVVFFAIPFVIGPLLKGQPFWSDPIGLPAKDAHVYVSPAFKSVPLAIYVFVLIPLLVYFFGKRYCTWFCACGNLAETVGVTPWGADWVRHGTPRGPRAKAAESFATACLIFALLFGVNIVMDGARLVSQTSVVATMQAFQDLVIDFLFGSVIGVGAYPFLGTRVWCRFGCPLAKGMQLLGYLTKSRFQVVPSDACKGLNLCTQACPMGIDVAAYAHKDKVPTKIPFGLSETPCIGCGGCIEACPVKALSFGQATGIQ